MTKSFDDIVSNFKDPRSEWEVFVNGEAYNEVIELLEFRQSLNSPVEFTVRLKGLPEGIEIPEDSEVVIKKSGLTVLRGVAQEFKPDSFNQYQLKGAGYSAELKGDSKAIVEATSGVSNPFKDSSVTEVVDTLIDGATTGTATARTFSTNYSLDNSLSVDDFRANSKQLEDVNRLMGEYGIEWYLSFDGSNNPVFNVTDQIQNDDGSGGSIGTLKTYGSDQTAEKVDQNVNRNKGSFDGVKVRGYGDGDDQITASAGSTGKDSRVLIYTDKTILSPSQAQKRADAINEYKTVAWQEIEVKPNNPNALYSIGDLLTVDSEKAYLSDDYRVVESYYKIWPGENQFESKLNLSNKPQTFLSEFQGEKAKRESQTDYMQGARNIWSDKEAANATNAEPLTIDFEVPQDVVDKAGNNRLGRIEFNYACAPFKQTSGTSEANTTNFNPSGKVIGADVKPGGVEIERSNIQNHNHAVGSATSGGANEVQASDGFVFDQSISASGWNKLTEDGTTTSVVSVPDVDGDLEHEFDLEINRLDNNYLILSNDTTNNIFTVEGDATTDLSDGDDFLVDNSTLGNNGEYIVASVSYNSSNNETDITVGGDVPDSSTDGVVYAPVARDLQYVLLGSSDTPTASFNYSPSSPSTSDNVEFVSSSGPGRIPSQHWRIDDVTNNEFEASFVGRNISHSFDKAADYEVTLEIYRNGGLGGDLLESDSVNNVFIFETDITADLESGDTVVITDSDGNDGRYTIDSFTTNANGNTEVTVFEDVNYSYTDSSAGQIEYFPESGAALTDSVTQTVSVSTAITSLSSKDQKKVEALDRDFDIDKEQVAQRVSSGEDFEKVASEEVSAQTSAGISIDNPADGDVLRLDGTETITFSGSVFDTGNGGTLTARLLQLPGSVISTTMYTENIPANDQDFANFVPFSGDRSFDDSSNDNFDGFGEYDWSAFYDEDGDGSVEESTSFTLYSADPSLTNISDTDTQSPVIDFEGAAGVGVNQIYLNIDGSQVKSYNTSPDRKTSRDMTIGDSYYHGDYLIGIEGGNSDNGEILVNVIGPSGDQAASANLEDNDSLHVNNDLVVGTEQVFFNSNDNTWTVDLVSYLDENNDITEAKETFTKELVNRDNPQTEPLRGFLYGDKIVFVNVFDFDATELATYINGSQQNNMTSTGVHPVNSGNPSAGKIKISKVVDNDYQDSVVVEKYVDESYEASGISDGQHDAEIVFEAENTTEDKNDETLSDIQFFDVNLNNPPTASFSFSPTDPEAFESVQFTDESGDPDGDEDIVEWRWDFGDGTTETITTGANEFGSGDTSHTYESGGDYTVELVVEDSAGTTDTHTDTVTVGEVESLDETILMDSEENVGGSPESISSSALETNGETILMGSSNNVGALSSPTGNDRLMSIKEPIPGRDMSHEYELYIATQGSEGMGRLRGDFEILNKNHTHDVPRQDDFKESDADIGGGAENKAIPNQKAQTSRGNLLLDFSTNDEAITLDTTVTGNDVTITVSNIDEVLKDIVNVVKSDDVFGVKDDVTDSLSSGDIITVSGSTGNDGNYTVSSVSFDTVNTNIKVEENIADSTADGTIKAVNKKNSETIAANGGTATTTNTYQDEELQIDIESANNQDEFDVRDQSGDDSYRLAAGSATGFTSSKTDQATEGVSGTDGDEKNIVTGISDNVLAGSQADNVQVFIDDDPDNDGTNSETEITGDLYNGNSNSGRPKDRELDINDYVDSPGWYRLKIVPDKPSFVKSRVFFDHHKDTE